MKFASYVAYLAFLQSLIWVGVCLWFGPRSRLNRAALIGPVFFAVWTFCLIFVYGADDMSQAYQFYQAQYWGTVFVVPSSVYFYLTLAGKSLRYRLIVAALTVGFAATLLVDYGQGHYYYRAFVAGAWGNVGVLTDSPPPLTEVSPFVWLSLDLYAAWELLRASAKSRSRRFRAQVRWAFAGIIGSYVVYFLAWIAETLWPLPPLEFLSGSFVISINCYLVLRYRYLRPDNDLLEKHVGEVIQRPSLLADKERVIVAANRWVDEGLGLSSGPLLGRDVTQLVSPRWVIETEWALAQAGRPVSRHVPCLFEGRTVLLSLTPYFDHQGTFGGCAVLLADMPLFDQAVKKYRLSARETLLALLVLQGASNQVIAESLEIAVGTVRRHLSNMFDKADCQSRNELIVRLTS